MEIKPGNNEHDLTSNEAYGYLSLAFLYAGVIRTFIDSGRLTEVEVGERLDQFGRDLFLTQKWKRDARRWGIPEDMRIAGATIALQEARPILFGEQKPPKESEERQNG